MVEGEQEAEAVRARVGSMADPARATQMAGFFKTGPGEYGEGDVFIGVPAPELNRVAREMGAIPLPAIALLLHGRVHEERMVALKILVRRYRLGDRPTRRRLAGFYLGNLPGVNNWDLVDVSAPWLLGGELAEDRLWPTALRLAGSPDLWRRRVAIVSTLGPVRQGQVGPAVEMAELLLEDREDLIQKATGWVLREVGKKDPATLTAFLDVHGKAMGRTALRYSIERMPASRRRRYLETTRQP